MKQSVNLDSLRIATPCAMGWEQMTGNDRVRFCDQCGLNVYNIAELSRPEAEALIASSEGRICARLFRRVDGTVLTKDCPVGLRALRMRVSKKAAAVFAALVSISSAAFGQQSSAKQEKTSCVPQMKITSKTAPSDQAESSVAGTVLDMAGAVVPGARVLLARSGTPEAMNSTTNEEGQFQLGSLAAGSYSLKIEAIGFKTVVIENVVIDKSKLLNIDLILEADSPGVTVGIIATDLLIDTSSPSNKTILTGDIMRRLPLPK